MFYRVIKPLGLDSWFYNSIKHSRSFIKQYLKCGSQYFKIRISNTWDIIIEPHNDQHPVGLIAQLVEQVRVSIPVQRSRWSLKWGYTWIEEHFKGFKEGIKERKLFLEHKKTVAPNPKAAHQVGRGLLGCPYINFLLQILILTYVKLKYFLFLKFYYSFEKNHQQICKTPQKSLTLSEVKSWMCPSFKPQVSIKQSSI